MDGTALQPEPHHVSQAARAAWSSAQWQSTEVGVERERRQEIALHPVNLKS